MENYPLALLEMVDPEEVEGFRVLIDARTRHPDLWPLVKRLGSNVALAKELGVGNNEVGYWINLKSVPNASASERYREAIERLHTLTGKSFEELWPPALRAAILTGKASVRHEMEVHTSMLALAQSARERLILADPSEVCNDSNEQVAAALAVLMSRERQAVQLRVIEGKTLDESAKEMGITRERVRQIVIRALKKLRDRHPPLPFVRDYEDETR